MKEKRHTGIGLTSEEAEKRLVQYGSNCLPEFQQSGPLRIFFHQFLSPLIYVLFAAVAVSFWMGHIEDAVFIGIVLLVNALIGTFQEYSAQKAAQALKKLVPQMAVALRDGNEISVPSDTLVPGDVVLLASGDKVPADMVLLSLHGLIVDESLLTGESVGIEKEICKEREKAEKRHCLFAGSIITKGRARGEVTATGSHTEIGKITQMVTGGAETKPPMLIRMEKFSLNLSFIVLAAVILLFIVQWARGEDLKEVFLLAVALAVSVIPEGLPAAITVTLAVGMHRMAKQHVIIRKLMAVESLGSCTLIASDKTGTLTINEMTIRVAMLPDGERIAVTGEGLQVDGHAMQDTEKALLLPLCRAGILANEAIFHHEGNPHGEGDKVDIAFLVLGHKCGLIRKPLLHEMPEIAVIPYESEHAYSGALHEDNGVQRLYIKGSVEALLPMCTAMRIGTEIVSIQPDKLLADVEILAAEGYRVMGLAEGVVEKGAALPSTVQPPQGLVFLGIVGMIDPLRAEAKEAVAQCHHAGIEVAMITGDHPVTALAIAKELQLASHEKGAVTGKQLHEASQQGDDVLQDMIRQHRVFARVEPVQKRMIVEALSNQGHFVAVTGDGVNDAPALQRAHVGIAMGKRGTDVARESADIILTDDNFASIVQGVKQGRIVYNNIRKVIYLLVSTGMAELVLFLFSLLFQTPMPLVAVQLLWLNLVTESVQHIALAFDPEEGDELRQAPRKPKEPIFNRLMIERIMVSAWWMGLLAFGAFYWFYHHGHTVEQSRNMALLLMVLFENIQTLNSRSERHFIISDFFRNKLLLWSILAAQGIHIIAMHVPLFQSVLHIMPVSLSDWLVLLVLAMSLLGIGELHKLFMYKRTNRKAV